MANKKDLDYTYTTISEIFRLSVGEMADFTGALYNGDFSLTLEEAQRKKHNYMANSLLIKKGSKVLDLGCGWGPFLNYLREIGAEGIGITLSSGQLKACQANGLNVHLMDMRTVTLQTFGIFDALVCSGSFEHLCSIEEFLSGKQDQIYHDFFKNVYELLPVGGRIYIDTIGFTKNMLKYEDINIKADKKSDAYALALMAKQFPGSWLSYGEDHVIRTASPYFNIVEKTNSRLDHIETINQWRKKFRNFNIKKYVLFANLIPRLLIDKEFRYWWDIFRISPHKVCMERELMDNYRLVFEKVNLET